LEDLPKAQHCFIQALMLERKSYRTWANLGVLYLHLNEVMLANQAFKRAQQSSPIYAEGWLGQAMLAETLHEEYEALDLFRHCQQFDYHPESALGYAHWVCKVLTDKEKMQQMHYIQAIEKMHADVIALDAINWHIKYEEDDASIAALCFQGFLNHRQKLYKPALTSYTLALKKCSKPGKWRDKLLSNLAFLYLKLNKPKDAVKMLNSVSEGTFTAIVGLAYAYYRAGNNGEAYSVYSSILESIPEDNTYKSSRVLAAVASVVYGFQDQNDTKTVLYQW